MRAAEATDRVAELILERMTRQGYQDDVTLLAVRLTGGPVPDLFADVPAEPGQLAPPVSYTHLTLPTILRV